MQVGAAPASDHGSNPANMLPNYWETYQRITAKLKKRFLRKPNYNDAKTELDDLYRMILRQGLNSQQYAAFCCLAIARCEQALMNTVGEMKQYTEAGRLFWEAERDSLSFTFSVDGSGYGYQEHALEAVECYRLAIEMYLQRQQYILASQLYSELGAIHKALKKLPESILYYQRCYEYQLAAGVGVISCMQSLQEAVALQIEHQLYGDAIESYTELINLLSYDRESYTFDLDNDRADFHRVKIIEFEVTRLLLFLLLKAPKNVVNREFLRISGSETLEKCRNPYIERDFTSTAPSEDTPGPSNPKWDQLPDRKSVV